MSDGAALMLLCGTCAAAPDADRRKLREITRRGSRLLPISALALNEGHA
jgi:hypothetical protein